MSIWYKALIVCIWLCVPVVGSLLVRGSYQRYISECALQRQDCLDRGVLLKQYAPAYLDIATRASWITKPEDHRAWVSEFRDLSQLESQTAATLRLQEPVHYPTADLELGELETLLRNISTEAKEAANYQLDYVNAGTRLQSLNGIKFDLGKTIHYYKQIGMAGIYLQLQEDLGQVEDQIRIVKRQRRSYQSAIDDSISDADSFNRGIQRGLNHLQDKINRDESQTFRQKLNLRLAEFNIIKEFKSFFLEPDSAL